MTTVEQARTEQQKISNEVTGAVGAVTKDYTNYKQAISSVGKDNFGIKTVDYLVDTVNNPLESQKVIVKEQIAEYGKGNDADAYKNSKQKNNAVLYEGLSEAYGAAAVNYAKLQQEQKDDGLDKKLDNRGIIQATSDKELESAARLSRILLMEASKSAYRNQSRNTTLTRMEAPSDDAPVAKQGEAR